MQKLPIINNLYSHFEYGIIKPSRLDNALVLDILEYRDVDKNTITKWEKKLRVFPHLYNPDTDYFIKAYLSYADIYTTYVRTLSDDWYSLNMWAGYLDVDGKSTAKMKKEFF